MKPIRWQQAATAAVLCLAAAGARADLAFNETDGSRTSAVEASPFALPSAPWESGRASRDAVSTSDAWSAERAFRLAEAAEGDPPLWVFMNTMNLLQKKQTFALLQSNARLIDLSASSVAPVPLPGAAWLMVMGLTGLAGIRLTRKKGPEPAGDRVGGPLPGAFA